MVDILHTRGKTSHKFIHGTCFGTVTIDAEMRQFGQSIFASVSCV